MSQTIPDSYTVSLLEEVAEFLEGQADVRDGSYGEQVPNRAMSLMAEVELTIERLKRDSLRGPVEQDRVTRSESKRSEPSAYLFNGHAFTPNLLTSDQRARAVPLYALPSATTRWTPDPFVRSEVKRLAEWIEECLPPEMTAEGASFSMPFTRGQWRSILCALRAATESKARTDG
jgi:hypothetical protein